MGLSLDDVLDGEFRFRTKTVDYGNGISFDLHSFDAPAFKQAMVELGDRGAATDGGEDYCVSLAMRAIGGQKLQPSPDQIAAFKRKLDKGVIEAVMLDWIKFNRGAENLAEAAKKS